MDVQPGDQRDLPQWREVHLRRREVHASSASSIPRPPAPMPGSTRRSTRSTPPIRRSPSSTSSRRSAPSSRTSPPMARSSTRRRSRAAIRRAIPSAPVRSRSWNGCRATTSRSRRTRPTSRPGLPHLDSVTFRFLPVDQSRIDALSAGELDWADAIPLQQVPTLKDDPRFTYVTSPVAGIPDFLALNTKAAPFDNPKVRQADRAGDQPLRHPRRRLSRHRRARPRGSADRLDLVRRNRDLRRDPRHRQGQAAAGRGRLSRTASASNISGCRNTPNCSRPARSCATS